MTDLSSETRRMVAPMKALTVLLVEDHAPQRALLRHMLGRLGVTQIHEASCGRDAIALLHGLGFCVDLVITDLRMPDGDGLDVISAITHDAAVRQIALLTAADDDIVTALRQLPQQINGSRVTTFSKPISPAQLEGLCLRASEAMVAPTAAKAGFGAATLRLALERNEFAAFFEPQVDLSLGTVVGFEALVRWQHPTQGVLSPAHFLDEIEQHGLMRELTFALLRSALGSLSALRAAGYEGGFSINVAASCLEQPQFPSELAALVAQAGERCESVTLELTETGELDDSVLEISNLARLRLEGFHLAADDFGMGYSSLAKLQRGAFDEIKIDRDFCRSVLDNKVSRAAVESIVGLARRLGASCVAEGIETEDICNYLFEQGCPVGQGYFFSRALAPDAVVQWWRHWQPVARNTRVADEAKETPAAMLDGRSLERLDRRQQPAWIFDLDRLRMVWANTAGLEFWKAESLAQLLSRDFAGDMSIGTRQRLRAYRTQLRDGRPHPERWTVYPGGEPATVDCLLTGLYSAEGRASLLVEASPVGTLKTQEHYASESARSAAVPILVASTGGDLVWQNPLATHLLGLSIRRVADLLGGEAEALKAIDDALAQGQAAVPLNPLPGGLRHLHRAILRRSRDANDGYPILVITLLPDTSRLMQASTVGESADVTDTQQKTLPRQGL